MVEGPKVHLKQERLKILVGETLVNSHALSAEFQKHIGEKVIEIFCVGKELLFVLEQTCIRLHFGMSGMEVISKTNANGTLMELEKKFHKKTTGVLIFNLHILTFFETNITLRKISYADILKEKSCKDVLAHDFNMDSVVEWLYLRDTRPLMDSIMDQSILPGVGNVIKCEALFMSRLSPYSTASVLSRAQVVQLIKHLQEFSIHWYNCTKNKRIKLQKQIYGFSTCMVCQSNVSLVRDGKIQRITYFCPTCQALPSSVHQSLSQPLSQSVSQQECQSVHQIYANSNNSNNNSSSNNSSTYMLQSTTYISTQPYLTSSHSANQSIVTVTESNKENIATSYKYSNQEIIVIDDSDDDDEKISATIPTSVQPTKAQVTQNAYSSISNERMNVATMQTYGRSSNSTSSSGSGSVGTNIPVTKSEAPPDVSGTVDTDAFRFLHRPVCTCHYPAYLRRVHTPGVNTGRVYWACGSGPDTENVKCAPGASATVKRSGKRCNYFHWADASFPHCSCRSKATATTTTTTTSTTTGNIGPLCTLRRVLKPGPNNGKYFFGCGSQHTRTSCGYFIWAEAWNVSQINQDLKRKATTLSTNSNTTTNYTYNNTSLNSTNLLVPTDESNKRVCVTSKFTIPL